MFITSLLLSLFAAPEVSPQSPIFSCTITEHTLEATNLSHEILVVSFASADRTAIMHLALPAQGQLSFHFPVRALGGHWMEVTSLNQGHRASTGALLLQNPGDLWVFEHEGALESSDPYGTLLPPSITGHVQFPSCARSIDVGVPPPAEDPVVDEVTDLRRRIRRPI